MRKVALTRILDNGVQTEGKITFGDKSWCTLELPFKNNESNVSCVPAGNYPCKWTRSGRLSVLHGSDFYTYEILNVPERSGIRIHSANSFFQLKGCISLGESWADINADGFADAINSRKAVDEFNELMAGGEFELEILAPEPTAL